MPKHDRLDPATLALVRFAAAVALGDDAELRAWAGGLKSAQVPPVWVDELLLQSVLMTGYPRALIAFGIWRKVGRVPPPTTDADLDYSQAAGWTARGEQTCGIVYGDNYRKLRESVRQLHPALDAWMITEGYGRTLSRPGLDLLRRELCIVAQVAVLDAPRQLHSHLRGALHAGAPYEQVEAVLSVVNPLLSFDQWKRVKDLWKTVRESWDPNE